MNVSNAAMGAGVLSFPLAYKQAGWVFGSILTLVYGCIMTGTLIIIAKAARHYDCISYQDLLGKMFGPGTKVFLMYTVCNIPPLVGNIPAPAILPAG
jgi:amino acid permease